MGKIKLMPAKMLAKSFMYHINTEIVFLKDKLGHREPFPGAKGVWEVKQGGKESLLLLEAKGC